MKSIIVTPRDAEELTLVVNTLKKLGVHPYLLSEDEKEDITSALMMRDCERSEGKALVKKLNEEYS